MKAWMKTLCAALLLMILSVGTASAQVMTGMSVYRSDGVGETVSAWEREGSRERYLFLPAYMEGQMLTVFLSDGMTLELDDVTLTDGQQTDLLRDGTTLTLRDRNGTGRHITVLQSRNLPAVHLTTQSGKLDYIHEKKGNQEAGSLRIVTVDGRTDYQGAIKAVKGHGNATFVYEKKSYQLKMDEKARLLGMDPGKRFVLLANQHENALLRNRLSLTLAAALGLRFTPECRSVDLYVNGEFRGNYLLTDKVTIASGSVDVQESEDALEDANKAWLDAGNEPEAYGTSEYKSGTYKGASWPAEPEDVTGGYLFQLEYKERYKEETSGVVTQRGQAVVVKDPEEMSAAQGEYVNELLNRFERAIFAKGGVDPESGQHYTQIADLSSLARKYLIEEISKNYDANKSSQYFYKDSDRIDPLIYAGPVWDYDSAWGNYAQEGKLAVAEPRGLIAESGAEYSWWCALYRQADFREEAARIYAQELRPLLMGFIGDAPMPDGCALGTLDALEQELTASAAMNFSRWHIFNHNTRAVKTGANYRQNIEYLRTWVRKRIAYLDGVWGVQ